MILTIRHTTRYRFEEPPDYALQKLRLTPKTRPGQTVMGWDVAVEGGRIETAFDDAHMNHVQLISLDSGVDAVTVAASGRVAVVDQNGIYGEHSGFMPLWFFERDTTVTRPGPNLRRLVRELDTCDGDLDRLHGLMALVAERVAYTPGETHPGSTVEEVVEAGHGVCQDHAQVFAAAARLMGYPARYVSGYLAMTDREEQDAMHAWAEAYVTNLGWVGFDVSNAQSPDARYVRVATGLDYAAAAPVSGLRLGQGNEALDVALTVATEAQSQQSEGGQSQQQG